MSLRAYAIRRGVSAEAVSRAVEAGRLRESIVRDPRGAPKIADPELADRDWAANTRPEPGRTPRRQPNDMAAVQNPPPAETPDYQLARARRETALACMAELDLAERRGELIAVKQAREDVIDRLTTVRTLILGVPSRVAQRLPHLAGEVVPVLDDLLREALEELADEDLDGGSE